VTPEFQEAADQRPHALFATVEASQATFAPISAGVFGMERSDIVPAFKGAGAIIGYLHCPQRSGPGFIAFWYQLDCDSEHFRNSEESEQGADGNQISGKVG
jgi:hypothetical protein